MKRIKLKPPYLHYLMLKIQYYKKATPDDKNHIVQSINTLLADYSEMYGYKSIKFLPSWWKKDNGKVYLTVRFQVVYLNGSTAYYTFSHFDKIIKAYNE